MIKMDYNLRVLGECWNVKKCQTCLTEHRRDLNANLSMMDGAKYALTGRGRPLWLSNVAGG
jgi:hypothetical protein